MPKNLGGHVTLATPPFGEIFGDHVRTAPGNTSVKFQVRSFNRFWLIAFNAQKFRGSRDPATPPFGKICGVMSGLSLGRLVSNLNSVALTVFVLLAFNSHDRPLRTHRQTNRHTSNERIISAIHFIHLVEIMRAQFGNGGITANLEFRATKSPLLVETGAPV